MDVIDSFRGEHFFLSNFYQSPVLFHEDGLIYRSVEHAYQAAKTLDPEIREKVRWFEQAHSAKSFGKTIALRKDWEQVKTDVMYQLLLEKFSRGMLKEKLEATRPAVLIEENDWGDRFWGTCRGTGLNWHGRLLMYVRDGVLT